MLSTQFHRAVLRKLEACNTMGNFKDDVTLSGLHAKGYLNLDIMTFHALREHTHSSFPRVIFRDVCVEFVWELTGTKCVMSRLLLTPLPRFRCLLMQPWQGSLQQAKAC